MLHGIHQSKRIGVSTEFDHHKDYMPGDPLKHIDWKASARHEHVYVKRYIEDTALSVRLVLDRSGSMLQSSGENPTKYLQACRLIACLAYLILKEKDLVGAVMASSDQTIWTPVRSATTHLVTILKGLVTTGAADLDNVQVCLRTILDRAERCGLIVLVSDLMFDPVPVQRELATLQVQGHEILIFQIRDPMEEEFPFNRWVEFGDLENAATRHRIDTVPLKKIYRQEYQLLIGEWREWSKKNHAHFITFRSEEHVKMVLSEYLAYRQRM